jgi:hypothetical protein
MPTRLSNAWLSGEAPLSDDYVDRIRSVLAAHGISTYRFERTRRHRRVVVEHAGCITKVTFPVSGSDRRGVRSAEAALRRALYITARQVE